MRSSELDPVIKTAKTLLSSPLGRGALASVIGVIGVTSIPDRPAEAEQNTPCVKVGYTPDTILNDGKDATVLEVAVQEACRSGLLRMETDLSSPDLFTLDGKNVLGGSKEEQTVRFKDDGTEGDKKVGDWIFTSGKIRTMPNLPLNSFPGFPYEGINNIGPVVPLGGGVKMFYGDGSVRRVSPGALLVLDSKTPLVEPKLPSDSVQTTLHVINFRDDFSVAAQALRLINRDQDLRALTNTLYGLTLGSDPYHFLIITADKQIFLTETSPAEPNPVNGWAGTNRSLRSDFSGTGGSSYHDTDVARLFGSQGNLRQIVFTREPVVAWNVFHEMTHWVGAYLKPDLGLNSDSHWKSNHSAGGMVQGTRWVDNRDGTFTSLGYAHSVKPPTASKLEQYLWGWIGPDQVPPTPVALDENQQFFLAGTRIHGPFKIVTIQDIIAQHGVRTPGPETALRHLKMGYIYTTTGRLATPAELTVRHLLAQRIPILWQLATEGQSTMEFVVPKKLAEIQTYNGQTVELGSTLRFKAPPEATWVELKVTPSPNAYTKQPDGPDIHLVLASQGGEFKIPAPPGWFGMLPGMTYTWQVRWTDQLGEEVGKPPKLDQEGGAWSPWTKDTFKTRDASLATLSMVGPEDNSVVDSLDAAVKWKNQDREIFYYEVQISKDPTFNTNSETATETVWWAIVHGGITHNSWSPSMAGVQYDPNSTYYWRVRPRQQGDAIQLGWKGAKSFTTVGPALKSENQPQPNLQRVKIDRQNGWELVEDTPQPDAAYSSEGVITDAFKPQKQTYHLQLPATR